MNLSELSFLEQLLPQLKDNCRVSELARVAHGGSTFPIYGLSFGTSDPAAPCFALVGGVHGQERIGAQVVLSFLETLTELLHWDQLTQDLLTRMRIVCVPIVNPVGLAFSRRGNGNRVDLMRNAPVPGGKPTFLVGGQSHSPYLPWYRGPAARGGPMEVESQALCDFIRREQFASRCAIALDCHSGYGTVDRLWFPHSRAHEPYPDLAEAFALKNLLDRTLPNHVYRMEPCSAAYTIQGDLWDYLYDEHQAQRAQDRRFFPVTLEMGSWLWLKKNPIQIFSALGFFQPMHLHRHRRVLRRHLGLFDFFQRAVLAHGQWAFMSDGEREELRREALHHWEFEG